MDRVSIALKPTIIRACSMTMNICLMPSCTPPTRVPTAGRPGSPPKVSSHVVETLRPILCSTLVALTPLRSPSVPSSPTWYLGTRNMDRPLVPGAAPSGLASTRWKMFSVRSCSAAVMNRLTPSMCQVPSGCSIALVRPGAHVGAGVWLGEHHRRAPPALDRELGEALLLGGAEVPQDRANVGPLQYIHSAGLAPRMKLAIPHCSDRGAAVPPSSGDTDSRHHSASISARYDFLKDSGRVTAPVAGSNTGGLRSPSVNDSATGPSASLLTSASMSRAVSSSISANGPVPRTSWRPSSSKRLNSMSRRLLL